MNSSLLSSASIMFATTMKMVLLHNLLGAAASLSCRHESYVPMRHAVARLSPHDVDGFQTSRHAGLGIPHPDPGLFVKRRVVFRSDFAAKTGSTSFFSTGRPGSVLDFHRKAIDPPGA